MLFGYWGFLFLATIFAFIGTYQYLVPKITGGAVAFTTDDFVYKLVLGFIFTILLIGLGSLLAPFLFMSVLMVVYTSGPFAWLGFSEVALLVFIGTSLCCGVTTLIMGKTMPKTIRCATVRSGFKAGLAPGLVSTVVAMSCLALLISSLHFD